MYVPPWSLADETDAAGGSTRSFHRPYRRLQTSRDTTSRVSIRYFKNQTEVLGRTKSRDRENPLKDFEYNEDIDFDISQVLPTQVPLLGGCCVWGSTS
ncbi:hypothetical protein V1477_013708 [Vespula maculifrons]|uniref:Uncharacterized protein n=1 Tax=Vespula maculifrons TaxID=7453 RepID=A0ABD2BP20_VESMC